MENSRQQLILTELEKKGKINVSDMVELTGASESSIRRDLLEMDEKGLLKRVHGGATLLKHTAAMNEDPLYHRYAQHSDEKKRIAKYASALIEKNDFIYIDAGSTTLELVDQLEQKDICIVTNGLMQAQQLTMKGYKVICIGGEIRNITGACVGYQAIQALQKYHFTKGFFGTNGITAENGYTTPASEEASIKQYAMGQCVTCYILADHSKFDQVSSVTFGNIEEAIIITDSCLNHYIKDYTTVIEVK